jgi:FkbM family methyltransferase
MKKIIRSFLNRFGYEIIKTENWYISKSHKEKKVKVGDYDIQMPGSNTLLNTYVIYPDFNSNLGRLAFAIFSKYQDMTILDIGANVGDTISIFKSAIDVPIIGIEGDTVTFKYLEKNSKQFSDINIINTFLGEKKEEMQVSLEKSGFNTTVLPNSKGEKAVSFNTVDNILSEEKYKNNNIKLIKLDIEGFDTIVLRGSYEVIAKYKPALFFEYNRDNMEAINEDGLSTLLSFSNYSYNKIAFFDYRGRLLLVTSVNEKKIITNLHNYVIGKNNLFGYMDICIFHKDDDEIADKFLKGEEEYCGYNQ